jgi:DNA helicase-2/ATP-dependent DNA helicase PcrA
MLMPENDWVRLQSHGRSLHWDTIHAVEHALSSLKREALSDSEIERFLEDAGEDLALEIERQRRAENRLTYDDLPRMAELILANDKVASLYYKHFAAVIVDEYQDLTPQQLRLVNRIGLNRTTYAGDLAQGIYSFAGAKPAEVDAQIRAECSTVIEFAESHRSSPAVLEVVNSLAPLTHGLPLTCAEPASWPGGGLAGGVAFNDVYGEAKFTVDIARLVLEHAPGQRIGIIARTEGRRRLLMKR